MSQAETPTGKIITLSCEAGIKRDGTSLDGNFYSDGEWVRFRNGRPKKMGGYREIINGLNGPIQGVFEVSSHPEHLVYTFSDSGIQMTAVDSEGVGGSTVDRTPAGWASSGNYQWQYDTLYDATGSPAVKIICHRSHGSGDPDEDEDYPVYYGTATGTGLLTSTGVSVSGGCVVLQPFLFVYGNNGLIKNSVANDPITFTGGDSNTANVSGTKIVKGLPLRGGSAAPAGLFWSLDSLIRVSYVGGTTKWRYDTLTQKSTILAPSAVIDFDGIYYWPGVDRFLMYNGVVKEIPNPLNQDFFFDNLNWAYRMKVWVTALPRWGEIWWHFPKGDSTVCNHAIVYNVRENTWYDTPSFRSSGTPPRVLYFPIWADANSNDRVATDKYALYRHETGTDHVYGETQVAIPSWFESADLGMPAGGPVGNNPMGDNIWTRITRVEPDFVQVGDMTLTITGNRHPNGDIESSTPLTFNSSTGTIDMREQRRLLRLRFDSNTQGGNYHMGKVLMHLGPGDIRE